LKNQKVTKIPIKIACMACNERDATMRVKVKQWGRAGTLSMCLCDLCRLKTSAQLMDMIRREICGHHAAS
jgi:hypothetical protein